MFKRTTLKLLSKIAIGICILSAILSLIITLMEGGTKMAFLPLLSWAILAYASYCAMKLTGYDIYEEDLKGIGWSIYILFLIFVLFLLVGVSASPIIAIIVAGRLHWQKNSIEEWTKNNS
ncbi:hypothetical protein GCM10027035_18010 [Emticicia sediminis]